MQDIQVSFKDTRRSKFHTPDRRKHRTIEVTKVGNRYRVLVADGRYILFYGESAPMRDGEVPPTPVANQLKEMDDCNACVIDHKKYTIAGFGGSATLARKVKPALN